MTSVIHARGNAALIHLAISVVIALFSSLLILHLWFPGQYRAMAGGSHLLLLIVCVDVILGPLLTFVVFNPEKNRSELIRDLSVVCLLQIGGLTYGVHTVYLARPVALVFEQTRFRVVSFIQVEQSELPEMSGSIEGLPLSGPMLLSVRDFKDDHEKSEAAEKGLGGADVGVRPKFWQPYFEAEHQLRRIARPYTLLQNKYSSDELVHALPGKLGYDSSKLLFIPVVTRTGDWVAVLSADTLLPLDFIPKDGFFELATKS